MVKKLAIDWDDHELRYITAQCSGSSVKVTDVKVIDIDGRTPEEVLATEFQTAGLVEAETLVAIGRGKAELRELQLPPVPANELPDMVRFQSLRSFASISDNSVVDYLVTKQRDAGVEVIAAAVAPHSLDSIREGIGKASLSLKRIGLRPLAAAALHLSRQSNSQHGEVVLIDLLPDNAEIVVARDGDVVFVRTVRMPGSETARAKALAGELKRSLLACGVTDQLNGIILWGTEQVHNAEIQVLEEVAGCSVQTLNPFDYVDVKSGLELPTHLGRFAPLVGLLLADENAPDRLIDFLNPRKPEIKVVSPYRKLVMIGAPVAACALLALVVYQKLASLDQQIVQLRDSNAAMQDDIKIADESVAKTETVDAFLDGDVNWLQEIRRMAVEMPPSDQMIIRGVSAGVNARNGGGVLKIEGGAVNPAVIDEFEKALRDENHQVNGKGASERKSKDAYRWEFSESISVTGASIRDGRYSAINDLLQGSALPVSETQQEANDEVDPANEDQADNESSLPAAVTGADSESDDSSESQNTGQNLNAAKTDASDGNTQSIDEGQEAGSADLESKDESAEGQKTETSGKSDGSDDSDASGSSDPIESGEADQPTAADPEEAKSESNSGEESSLETKIPETSNGLEVAKVTDGESQR